jgi:Transglycosylase SLT domain
MRRRSVGFASVLVLLGTVLAGAACSSSSGGNGRSAAPKTATRDHATATTAVVRGPDDIALPDTTEKVAASLDRVERALRASETPPAELPRLGWEQQNAYRALRAHSDWVPDVLARLPDDLQPIVTANERARRDLAALNEPQPDLPDWQILSPPPVEVLRGYYAEAEAASGIPWAFFAAIHLVETNLGRVRGASTAGAQGPMQFIPATWDQYGQGDINDNRDAILAAARLLQSNGAPADMERALYRYNNSDRYVDAVQAHAQLMLSDERAFLGYYHWQVYYSTTHGTFLLPEGYPGTPAREVTAARR